MFSILAVHGLASNAETAWAVRDVSSSNNAEESHQVMWLRDMLAKNEALNARVMTFNHDTSWEAYALDKSLEDHGHDLLQALRTVRHDEKVRYDSSGLLS